MSEVVKLWKKYNECSQQLSSALGRTNNIVGEYGEYLAQKYTAGRLLETSKQSADIKTCDGNLYQVKARTIKSSRPESLSIIRSWKFDFLLTQMD
jgi:hypothetical protein